jgi:ribosomal peptide maturation radical SAM protein 1
MVDVCLVNMPYAAVDCPSLPLGLLKAGLLKHRVSVQVHYANIAFAEHIGLKYYFFFSNTFPVLLVSEWTFAQVAFPDFHPDLSSFYFECAKRGVSEHLIWRIRRQTPAFMDRVTEQILALKPKIVACSSMFQQHCASLALLRRIKHLHPEIITMMGGSNCEGIMGYTTHQQFPWLDYVVSGEADLLFPELVRDLLHHGRDMPQERVPPAVYGPTTRSSKAANPLITRAVVADLDQCPIPDYSDYFETLAATPLAKSIKPGLVAETARGCWWGHKHPCVFCGLNGSSMSFRSKSRQRIIRELDLLHNTYGSRKFLITDRILSHKYFKTVLPRLAKRGYHFLFETSANLSKPQIRQLADAGILWINPGIESMNDQLLRLLNKGTRTYKNIQLLKWCMQYGIFVSWVVLTHIPGDSIQPYYEMTEWLPLIAHLQPPITQVIVHYDRFSPMQQNPQRYHLKLRPAESYFAIYPLSQEDLNNLAYFFQDISSENELALQGKSAILQLLQARIRDWQSLFYESRPDILRKEVSPNRPKLDMHVSDGFVTITDTRPCAVSGKIVLEGLAAQVFIACDAAKNPARLMDYLRKKNGTPVSMKDLQPVIDQLVEKKILLPVLDRFLSLAVEAPYPAMLTHDDYPGGLVMIPRSIRPDKPHSADPVKDGTV